MKTTRTLAIGAVFAATTMLSWTTQGVASTSSIQCGETYVVKSGDTLGAIAARAYGNSKEFRAIYSVNSDLIGPNPGLIEIGMRFDIPCLNAALAPSTANADAITIEKTTEALPLPDPDTIRFVVGTDWAPFTNEDQEQGGMVVEITNVAMENADGAPNYQIDFINDWGAHLQPLISDHAYDFSLAWFRPNCDIVERLGDGSKFRCNNLGWSEPLFEQIFGYYTRTDGLRPAAHEDLMGTRICRPAGYAIFQLEEHNLVEPNVTLARPGSPAECFQGLAAGEYDVVAISSDVADGAISQLGIDSDVYFNENLSQVLTMHAVISNTHPRMEDYLDTLNSGIW
ncbi:MAG: LysM peptidoglycan-binding domain-containing protein [Litoreibacter sp.]|nr:LysM peptidoglycan-binding domain-containing protein [Litoreibacter sp.]